MMDSWKEGWQPVSKPAFIGWTAFYSLFLLHAATNRDGFLVVDQVNLIVHEAGHLLFGWLGQTPGVWGGTLFELIVPAALAIHFGLRREATGVVFCLFFFFENFLYISVYMADARAQVLPLVTVGDPEMGSHDWFAIFSSLGLLYYDTGIGRFVCMVGWLGMLAAIVLLWWFYQAGKQLQDERQSSQAPA
ncbi:MAG: hypothetical protein EXQ56_04125 [Acidobacteria bacterium]|nr:hypothetical protein [Acidobacteriota bacterium]